MWKPETNAVQTGLKDGRFANGEFSLLAAGPPRLANIGPAAALSSSLVGEAQGLGQIVHPLGLVQQIGMSQSTQFSRIFEIGSRRSYFIPGRSVGQLQLGKVWLHGATLLRMLYAYYQDAIGPVTVSPMLPAAAAAAMANPHNVIVPPGYENVFLNMGSDLFSQMMGLLWYIKDNNSDILGAIYLEGCTVPNHSIQTDSQGLVFSESAGVQFERVVPVEISAVPLISINNDSSGMANTDYPGLEAALGHGDDRDPRHGGGQSHLPARSGRHPRPSDVLHAAGRQALRPVSLRPVGVGVESPGCPRQRQDGAGHLRARYRGFGHRPRDRHHHSAPGRDVPHRGSGSQHHPQHHPHAYRSCGRAWYSVRMKPLPESFTASLLKEAQEGRGLDALARFAAAAVVMKMLDSSRDRAEGARAQAHAKALLERSEAVSLQREVGRPGAPRLFVQAETPDGTEDVGDRYHSGFLPNVPVGMDQGMVRLAEEKVAMGPLVPPAPAAKVFARKGLLSDLKGPAGFKLAPPSAQPKTAPVTPAAPASKPHPLLTPGGLATLGVLGAAGVGLNKALDSATGYMNQEAPPTDWAMRRYGALSPAQTTNVYGQPNY